MARHFKSRIKVSPRMRVPTAAAVFLAVVSCLSTGIAPAADVSGTKWFDTNKDGVRDSFEPAIPGWTIYADLNGNQSLDSSDISAVTDINGVYTLRGLSPGTYQIWEVPREGFFQTFPTPATQFNIELVFPDSSVSEPAKAACRTAAHRWEAIIVGDLPNVGSIDDLRISVTAVPIDGPYGTLAQANSRRFRSGSELPYDGFVLCDSVDVDPILADGRFVNVITHEMGHVLGIGVMNGWYDRVNSGGSFTGSDAAREYQSIFGLPSGSLPPCDSASLYSHWNEDAFDTELMSPILEFEWISDPLSRITVGAISDLGYRVNMGAAEPFAKPGKRVKSGGVPFCGGPPVVVPEFVEVSQKAEPKALDTQLRAQVVTIVRSDQLVTGIDFGNSAYSGRATPTPGPTPKPGTPTPTSAASPTVSPTPIPSPTASPLPSASPTPWPSPTPSPSPSPSPTPIPIPICDGQANLVLDGDFEQGSGAWELFDEAFGSPVCGTECSSSIIAYSGSKFLWFGGLPQADHGRAAQTVALPPGTRNIQFQLWLMATVHDPADVLTLTIDGTEVGRWTQQDAVRYGAWTPVSIDVSRFADGSRRAIKFECVTTAASVGNSFLVDRISIQCPGAAQRVVELTIVDTSSLDANGDSVLDAADIMASE